MYKQPYVKLAITIKLDGREKTRASALFVYTDPVGPRSEVAGRGTKHRDARASSLLGHRLRNDLGISARQRIIPVESARLVCEKEDAPVDFLRWKNDGRWKLHGRIARDILVEDGTSGNRWISVCRLETDSFGLTVYFYLVEC